MSTEVEISVQPIIEPVSVAEFATHMVMDSDFAAAQSTKMLQAIKASRKMIERMTSRSLLATTWQQVMDITPGMVDPLILKRRPVLSLVSVDAIVDWETDTWVSQDLTGYVLTGKDPGRVLTRRTVWPITRGIGGFRVVFKAGYGDSGAQTADDHASVISARAAIPENIREAVLQYAGHLWEHRKGDGYEPQYEAQADATRNFPRTIRNLIEPYMNWRIGGW